MTGAPLSPESKPATSSPSTSKDDSGLPSEIIIISAMFAVLFAIGIFLYKKFKLQKTETKSNVTQPSDPISLGDDEHQKNQAVEKPEPQQEPQLDPELYDKKSIAKQKEITETLDAVSNLRAEFKTEL